MYDHQPRIPPPASGTQNMRRGPYPLSLCTATPSTCAHASHSQLTARARAVTGHGSCSTFTILIQSHREPLPAARRGRGESQTRNRRVLLLAGWRCFCELETGAADVRLYATPALPLIANWHIPLQNFPQVDIWAGLFYCVLPFFLLVTSS